MHSLIAKIHIAKKQLAMDDHGYRAALERATGKRSAKDLTRPEALAAIKEFERLGFRNSMAGKATGKYAPVLKALWYAAYNLGIARSKDDKALIAFVQRQTGVSHTRFLTDEADARKAIEGLKAWITREAGVDWPGRNVLEIKRAIIVAQWRRLVGLGAVSLMNGAPDLDGLGEYIGKVARGYKRRISSHEDHTITAEELDKTQAALGRWIRKKLGGTSS